jgi:hypothetical protein
MFKSYVKIEPPNENADKDVRGGYIMVEFEFEKVEFEDDSTRGSVVRVDPPL